MPVATVNGTRLFYEQRGSGTPILGIHGGGSTHLLWLDAAQRLAEKGRAIVYDRRGCGRSERPDPYDRTTVAEQADDAAALLADLAAAPAAVVARSYGGAVALDLAIRHPDKVAALALLEADALALSPEGLDWTRGLRDRMESVAADRGVNAVYEALVEEVFGAGAWATFPPPIRDVLTANGPALLAELSYVEEPGPDPAALQGLGIPVLLVMADESPPPQRQMTEALASAIPGARLVEVSGGHLIDPAGPEVLAYLDEVLERTTPRTHERNAGSATRA